MRSIIVLALLSVPFIAAPTITCRADDCVPGAITTVAGYSIRDGGPATSATLSDPTGVAVGPDGSLYIADPRQGRVRRVDPAGVITTVVGGGNPADRLGDGGRATEAVLWGPSAVAVGPDGSLYIADCWNHRVRKVDPNGIITTLAGDGWMNEQGGGRFAGDGGPAVKASLNHPAAIALGRDGSVYVADTNNHRVRKVDAAGVITSVAGDGWTKGGNIWTKGLNDGRFTGDGGPASGASLNNPAGLAVGADGVLYIADKGNRRVRRVGRNGVITTLAGGGKPADKLGDGGPAMDAALCFPERIALGPDGSLYIADVMNHRIRRVTPAGTITTAAGSGPAAQMGDAFFSGDGGPAIEARLSSPQGVAVGPDGTLYLADSDNRRVRHVRPDGTIVTIAGGGVGDGGPALEASLEGPQGIALAPDGGLYVADTWNHRIRKVDPLGTITTVAGDGVARGAHRGCYSGDGGPATAARLGGPADVATGADGSLYIADTFNQRVRKVDPAGVITTVAGNGEPSFSGDGGPAAAASLHGPQGIALDDAGNLYIADTENHRIRKVDPAGVITTIAGGLHEGERGGYSGDGGPATQAGLSRPKGVAAGPDGSLYIADTGNNRTRRVDPAGVITTVAGNDRGQYSGDRGPATKASLHEPSGMAVGADGTLYIADAENYRVRRIDHAGTITTVAGGDGELPWPTADQPPTLFPHDVEVSADGTLYIATGNRICQIWLPPDDPAVARAAADRARATAGDSRTAWCRVVNLYLAAEAWDDAMAAAEHLRELIPEADEPGRMHAEILTARAYVGKRDDHEARRRLLPILARAHDPTVLRQAADALVNLYLLRGERDQAVGTLTDLRMRTDVPDLLKWIDRRLKEVAGTR
jgi:sugar lactone lactonase YvrE